MINEVLEQLTYLKLKCNVFLNIFKEVQNIFVLLFL